MAVDSGFLADASRRSSIAATTSGPAPSLSNSSMVRRFSFWLRVSLWSDLASDLSDVWCWMPDRTIPMSSSSDDSPAWDMMQAASPSTPMRSNLAQTNRLKSVLRTAIFLEEVGYRHDAFVVVLQIVFLIRQIGRAHV